jgi:hypothetical protein
MNWAIFWLVFGSGILITSQMLIHREYIKLESYAGWICVSWLGLLLAAIGAGLL